MYAASLGCAKVFWPDLNIEMLAFHDVDNSDRKKNLFVLAYLQA